MADTSPSDSLPPGVSKPLGGANNADQSGVIAILTAFSLGLVLVSGAVRVYARHALRSYRMDDYIFFAAAMTAVLQACLVIGEVAKGLGRRGGDMSTRDADTIHKLSFAASLLHLTTLFLSKTSTCFLFIHLTPERNHRRAIWTTTSTCVSWIVLALLTDSTRCNPSHPWTDNTSNCHNAFARWLCISILDILSEAALVATSIYIVWNLQMRVRGKLIVAGAFGCRLPNIAFTLLHLVFLHRPFVLQTAHIWLSRVTCTTQLSIGYSVTASVIPYLKPFMLAYENTTFMPAPSPFVSGPSSKGKGSVQTSKSASVPLDDIEDVSGERPWVKKGVGKGREQKRERGSDDSRAMIIKKGVGWSVQYGEGAGVA